MKNRPLSTQRGYDYYYDSMEERFIIYHVKSGRIVTKSFSTYYAERAVEQLNNPRGGTPNADAV